MPKKNKNRFRPSSKWLSPLKLVNFMLVFALVGIAYLIFVKAAPTPGLYGSVEKDQVSRINSARSGAGVGGLQHIECLNTIAEDWTKKMAAAGGISHNPSLESEVDSKCGGYWSIYGENVGVGFSSQNLFDTFMGSAGHRANILDSRYKKVGIGAYWHTDGKLYITQVFANCSTCTTAWSTNASVPADPVATSTTTGISQLLRNSNSAGGANTTFNYGTSGDKYLYCDWDGNGDDTVAAFRPSSRYWYIRNSNSAGASSIAGFGYGTTGDLPICGDWDGDGVDTIGVFRPSTKEWIMRNSNSAGTSEIKFVYGTTGDQPVVGDWDGDGVDTIGVFRPSSRYWYIRNSNSAGASSIAGFGYGSTGDIPVVGDWDGNGTTTVGVRRGTYWYLRNSNSAGGANLNFSYGLSSDKPIVGNWDGTSTNLTTTIGVVR